MSRVTDQMIVGSMRESGMLEGLTDDQVVEIFKDKSLHWAVTELRLNVRELGRNVMQAIGVKL